MSGLDGFVFICTIISPFLFPSDGVSYNIMLFVSFMFFLLLFILFCFSGYMFDSNTYRQISLATAKTPGDTMMMEVNMESSPRTIHFFVNGEQQNGFYTNIPDSVRFTVCSHLHHHEPLSHIHTFTYFHSST